MNTKDRIKRVTKTTLSNITLSAEALAVSLAALNAEDDNKKTAKFYEDANNICKNIDTLYKSVNKYLDNNETKHKKSSNTTKKKAKDIIGKSKVSFTDNVQFSDVKNVSIDKTVGKLPIDATISIRYICKADITVVATNKIILHKGAVLRNASSDELNTMSEYVKSLHVKSVIYKKVKGFKGDSATIEKDIRFESTDSLLQFVLGRSTTLDDSKLIKVGKTSLEKYLLTGMNN